MLLQMLPSVINLAYIYSSFANKYNGTYTNNSIVINVGVTMNVIKVFIIITAIFFVYN